MDSVLLLIVRTIPTIGDLEPFFVTFMFEQQHRRIAAIPEYNVDYNAWTHWSGDCGRLSIVLAYAYTLTRIRLYATEYRY